MEAQNAIYLDKEMGGKGRQFKCRFLVPGLVKYDYGVCLLTKENADKFIQGFIGCPVVINHQDVTDANAKDVSVGNIFSVWFDEKDGYYWCNGIITDKHAIELIDKGYSVSCQYTITEYSDNNSGALHNGNPYDKIIENGKPEHLAIVNNPRYEGAIIAVNAILASNEDQWITIKPNGEDAKGRHLLIKEGETVHEAMQRTYGIDGAKGQQKLFDTSGDRKTKEDYKREAAEKQKKYDEHQKQVQKRYDNLEYLGVSEPEKLKDVEGEEMSYEKWESQKQSGTKESKETYYDDDMEEYYTDSYADSIKKDFDEFMKSKKEEKKEESKSEEDKSIDKYLTDKSDKGWLYETKGTSTYSNSGKSAEVEEFGKDGGKYRVVFYDGNKRKDIKAYSTKRGMEKAVREHLSGEANKETKALETKTDLNAAKEKYNDILKKYNEAEHKKWQSGISNAEYHQAWDDSAKYKKELTTARREYAESIMANFEMSDDTSYQDRQDARRERYQELAQKAATESSKAHQLFRDKMSYIPAGQPIHGAKDARYREKTWDTLGRAVKLSEKSDYYADKANSVGKAGISADDANAIAKLAQKYKSGVDSAEKRRIIDRVIEIHKNAERAKEGTQSDDYKDLGFTVERNADINRLQLKFEGKPSESVRSVLKHNGFRWSPREGAWQRQLTGNAESSLKRVAEELKASNNFIDDFKETLYDVISGGIFNRLGEFLAQNKNDKEKWITIKGNHILLKEGETIADAFKRATGETLQKSNNPKDTTDLSGGNRKYKEALAKVKRDNQKEISQNQVIENAIKSIQESDNKKKYTPEEIKAKIKEALEYNLNIARNNWQTYQYYSDGKGHYKKNRQELHKKILNDLFLHANMAKPKSGEKPTFMVLGGRGGSGKSKFDGLVYDKSKYIVLDADAIKEKLPEYKGLNAFEVHEESSDILNKALKIARKRGLNVVLDGTMKTLSSTEKKIKAFKDADYNIEMYYMHLPREKAAERAIGRFMGERGRFVPLNVLLNMKNNEENFDKLKHYASKWAFYNNDVPSKENKPILIDKNY